ncbi:TetR/AcrR family transcriptional regulator [Spirillospora sp. CA-294931]|uniref:TetR/AcrR family transcriptional regulator n=1 Tax=Spirillospora sp. CA-294931 TaxID=3240042 RepID=UPI003D8E8B7A
MGNREDLLAGAKRCLYEKGYARTTVRDIASAAGVSMAAIGYHFGSKEALLNAALAQANKEWGDELARALATEIDPGTPPLERFEAIWTHVIGSMAEHRRLWAATFDTIGQVQHVPEIRDRLAEALAEARVGLAEGFGGVEPGAENVWAIGSFYQALLTGIAAQFLIDPDRVPTGHELAEALRAITSTTPT